MLLNGHVTPHFSSSSIIETSQNSIHALSLGACYYLGLDLAEWLERCASISKITGSNLSGGSELTFRSDLLLLIARGGST
jgi:hypothetical protein